MPKRWPIARAPCSATANLKNDPRWIYNDYEKGFAEGKRTGKPVLIVLRCIPCLACAGIDAKVLLENTELTPLLDQFVCVRVINANALDLAKFQFDFDLSFTTMIFNGDGTLYGRYGSWTHQKDPREETTDGFKRALESVLAIHKSYPANQASLAAKQESELLLALTSHLDNFITWLFAIESDVDALTAMCKPPGVLPAR